MRTPSSPASINCSTVSSGRPRGWRRRSTHRRSTWRRCARSGAPFVKRRAALRPNAAVGRGVDDVCGPSSRRESARQEQVDLRDVVDAGACLRCVRCRRERDGWEHRPLRAPRRSGQVLAASLLEQYRATLDEIRQVGYTTYATRQLRPYVRAAVSHFSPAKSTLTERLLDRHARKSHEGT